MPVFLLKKRKIRIRIIFKMRAKGMARLIAQRLRISMGGIWQLAYTSDSRIAMMMLTYFTRLILIHGGY